MYKILLCVLLFTWSMTALSQDNFPINDVKDNRTNAYAFTNATIHIDPQTVLHEGTLLIKQGVIIQTGRNINIPAGYTKIDATGKHIYPSFIEVYGNYGLPEPKKNNGLDWSAAERITPLTKGAYNANDAIRSYYEAVDHFVPQKEAAKELRTLGFGAVSSFMKDGIARGSSVLATLGNKPTNQVVLSGQAAAHYSFDKGSSKQYFPVSTMGAAALLRQTYMDAAWYQSARPFTDLALDSWNAQQPLPQVFEANDKLTLLRADAIGDEFGVQYIIKGGGDEYQLISAIKATKAPLIIPVNFPKAYEVDDPMDTRDITLAEMKHWELAPTNPAALASQQIPFALTTADLKDKSDFLKNIKIAIDNGLTKSKALEALTVTPAKLLKVHDRLGSLHQNKMANFIITSGDIFDNDSKIYENWIQGDRYPIETLPIPSKIGTYDFTIHTTKHQVELSGKPGSYTFKIVINDSTDIKINHHMVNDHITIRYTPQDQNTEMRGSGWKSKNGWKGQAQLTDGSWAKWSMEYTGELDEKGSDPNSKSQSSEDDSKENLQQEPGQVIYPFVAYGTTNLPDQETLLIKNATVWTNESSGILKNTDVLIQNGKISKVGKELSGSGARVIDGTGKHLTPGIIDEHSHIAMRSWNDVATNSSMVRVIDVMESEDINIYRQLSGGVTAAQLLHGSANPVGGQSAIIKLRWGASPDNMLIKDAHPFIKFALGENVKRSRSSNSIRYPQTRMGVEQVYVDAFTNALRYENEWKAYRSLPAKEKVAAIAPRQDIVHDTMLEILKGERFISCHSYVQSEINMLMKVAEKFNFKVNTFTHILEGYKLADKMKAHGVGASTFADWWAYKWEVRYAIPYNASLMHNEGLTVAINSDDAEMGRRLNQEAAKSVKYGGMSEEDALKMVTLNPAKLLHLDDRMGSIKVGKDGDVVLWSDHPLSIYAKVEKTIIDGNVYYDIKKDTETRKSIESERIRLINKMKAAKKSGESTQQPKKKELHLGHCEDIIQAYSSVKNK